MARHKFSIGQQVRFDRESRFHNSNVFEITRLLPEADGELKYRLKSKLEAHERVGNEIELVLAR